MPTAIYIVAVVSLVIFFVGFALYAVYTHSTRASLAARSAADAVLPLHGDVKLIHARAIPSHWPRFLAPVRTEIASKHTLTDLPFFNSHRAGLEIVENGEKHSTLTVIGPPWPTQVDPVQVHLLHETQLHSLASPEHGLPLPLKALIADEVLKRAIQTHGHAMKQSDISRSSQFFESRSTQVPFVRPSRHVIRRLSGFVRIACISAPYLTGHPPIELQPLRGKGTTIFIQPFDYAPVSLNMPGSGKSGSVHYRGRWRSSARRRWSGAARVVRRDILRPTSMKSVVTPQPVTVGPTKDDFFAPLNYPEDYYDLEFMVPSHEDGSALALRLIDAVSFVCATVVCAGFYVGSHVSSRFLAPPYPRYDKSDKALLFPTAVRRYLADPNGDLYSIMDARLFAHVHSLVSRLAYLVPRY